jgi:ABC-2 type transport system permease protein
MVALAAGSEGDHSFDDAVQPVVWQGSSTVTQIRVLTGKSVRALIADRHLLLISSLEPVLMLVVFGQVFASIIQTPGFPPRVSYTDFLVPAIMVNGALQAAVHTGAALTDDMKSGVITRLRSLPIWIGSVLVARSLASLVGAALRLLFLLLLALLLFGFHPAGGAVGVLAALGLALMVGWCLGWIFMALACRMRSTELAQTAARIATFPLMFASNAFVPVSALPSWLQAVAQVNPMTYGINAARNLTLAHPTGGGIVVTIAISLAIAVMAGAVAVSSFGRAG